MKIRTISWARNEADILESFIRHHAAFSTLEIVLHRCHDNSEEILEALKKAGLPVVWRTDERLAHEQAKVMSEMMRKAFAEGVDFVVPLDADEFLTGDAVSVLSSYGDDPRAIRLAWKGYVPTDKDDASHRNVLKRITHRRSIELPQRYKILAPRTATTAVGLRHGNHVLLDTSGRPLPHTDTELAIAHFPVRSAKQIMRKVYGGWLSRCVDVERRQGNTFQWKAAFERLKEERPLLAQELTQLAMDYATEKQWKTLPESFTGGPLKLYDAQEKSSDTDATLVVDPVPCNFDVRYPVKETEPMHVLLESAEEIAQMYAELKKKKITPDSVSDAAA
ncbi:MAG: glycosyltransferase family 2 protein [Candidatus Peribacteraceae bacterium]|nr:glycosyltransferase family 2 protein [Candidatus Peribacteraceae bacterium]